jgi:hypothetical protein
MNDEVMSAMEKIHSTMELITHWSELESNVFGQLRAPQKNIENRSTLGTAPCVARGQAMKFMADILKVMAQEEVLGHACVLLDAFCVTQSARNAFTPTNVVAAALIAAKFSDLLSVRHRFHQAAQLLTQVFGCSETVCVEMLRRAELQFLAGLTWRVSIPSIDSWSMTILARIAALTGSFAQSTHLVRTAQPVIAEWCKLFMFHVQASAECPPRTLAIGAVVMGLVSQDLLNCDNFLMLNTSLQVWQKSLESTLAPGGSLPVLQDELASNGAANVKAISVEMLAEACDVTMCQLEFDVLVALKALSHAY